MEETNYVYKEYVSEPPKKEYMVEFQHGKPLYFTSRESAHMYCMACMREIKKIEYLKIVEIIYNPVGIYYRES